jgi:hypothetical protein
MTIADRAAQLAADECRLDEAERRAFRDHLDRKPTREMCAGCGHSLASCLDAVIACCPDCDHWKPQPWAWRDFEPQRIELVRVEGGWVAVVADGPETSERAPDRGEP